MTTIHDVAAYIVNHFESSISTMKLQKLAFFSQGWSLALLDAPLFDSDFEAWANGPVSYDLFDLHRGEWSVRSWSAGDANKLTKKQKIVVDAALRNYGALSGRELSELTHLPGTPWAESRRQAGVTDRQRASTVIDLAEMKKYFKRTLL